MSMDKMTKARGQLMLWHAFFATLMLKMPLVESTTIPTMATDGKTIWFNPSFVDGMTVNETVFVCCHEVMHCVFQHMLRRGERDPQKWNIAADYVINDMLIKAGVGSMPSIGLNDPDLVARGKDTIGVYNLLPDNPSGGGGGASGNGTALDEVMDAPGDPSEAAAMAAEIKAAVAQASNAAKMRGQMPADLARMVDELLNPKVPWQEVLRRWMTAKVKDDYSYANLNQVYLTYDLLVPTRDGEGMGEVVIAVDTSGSIGPKQLAEFAAEMRAILGDCKPKRTHVVYFDSRVQHHDQFGPDEELTVAAHGGGGTAFSPIFDYIDKEGVEPAVAVVLTDLCCNDFGPAPAYPVLWATTDPGKAPWGEIVEMF